MLALVLIMPCMVRVFMIYFFEFTLSILNLLETRSSRDHRLPWAEATYLFVHDPTKRLANCVVLQKSNDIVQPGYSLVVYQEKDSWQIVL